MSALPSAFENGPQVDGVRAPSLPIRTGDIVRYAPRVHLPAGRSYVWFGELWTVVYVDPQPRDDGLPPRLIACGTHRDVPVEDVELERACSDEEHRRLLEEIAFAKQGGKHDWACGSTAQSLCAELLENYRESECASIMHL